ncbi:MAG TPA: non-ribosomal peptide synthetase [Steroidobacteraceae bacterium]|nr:non-ribosomal peptide synthetase [Steroidobacteraceae bacterium]
MPANSIPEAFAAALPAGTERVALEGDGPALTYGELAARSDALAAGLAARGIGRGARVGLYANRSAEAVAAMLGVLKAGAAYVPFDTSYPANLLRYLYEDSAPALMLVQERLLQDAAAVRFWRGAALGIGAALEPASGLRAAAAAADDPAYVMYTSGSTGRPKGVVVPHRAVLRLVLGNDFAALGPDQVILQLAPLSFDASTFEVWGALLNGARLAVIADPYPSCEDIGAAIARHHASTLWLTAGLFHLMVDHNLEGLAPLQQLLAGGDVLSPAHVVRALRALPGCRLINGYGPTENTTFSCCYTIPRDYAGDAPVPIGRAIRQTEALVLDESLRPVAAGEPGELCLAGAGLALGYWNRPELTAQAFVTQPASGTRMYRTGDRVRWRADGNLEFLGRVDRQVKINGKRVELDEIEARLRATGLVQDAAVVCTPASGSAPRHIAAFVTAAAPLDLGALRRTLREELPDYMMPGSISQLPALPLSPSGKIDRARLPLAAPGEAVKGGAATNDTEAALLEIWRRVLGTSAVGVDDNFFDLGGTSLGLMEVHANMRRSLASDVTIVEMFQYPRISALAARLTRGAPAPRSALLDPSERARRAQAALARRRPGGKSPA